MQSFETRNSPFYWLWTALYDLLLASFLFNAWRESLSAFAVVPIAIVFLLYGLLLLSDGMSGMQVTIDSGTIVMRRWNGFGATHITEIAVAEYQDIRFAGRHGKAIMLLASGKEIPLGISGAKGMDVASFIEAALRDGNFPRTS